MYQRDTCGRASPVRNVPDDFRHVCRASPHPDTLVCSLVLGVSSGLGHDQAIEADTSRRCQRGRRAAAARSPGLSQISASVARFDFVPDASYGNQQQAHRLLPEVDQDAVGGNVPSGTAGLSPGLPPRSGALPSHEGLHGGARRRRIRSTKRFASPQQPRRDRGPTRHLDTPSRAHAEEAQEKARSAAGHVTLVPSHLPMIKPKSLMLLTAKAARRPSAGAGRGAPARIQPGISCASRSWLPAPDPRLL